MPALGGRVLYEVRLAVAARPLSGAQQRCDGQLLRVGGGGVGALCVGGQLAALYGAAGRHLCTEGTPPRPGPAAPTRPEPPPLQHQLRADLAGYSREPQT